MTNRPSYLDALKRNDILSQLKPFDPHVAGTPPLGLDLPNSDIDILCYARDAATFSNRLYKSFSHLPTFAIRQWTSKDRPIVARFIVDGWTIEIFGASTPVIRQAGWRHFLVEQRLLKLGGAHLHATIMAARDKGLKTEPAFAHVLNMSGDPYHAILTLSDEPDATLVNYLRASGHHS